MNLAPAGLRSRKRTKATTGGAPPDGAEGAPAGAPVSIRSALVDLTGSSEQITGFVGLNGGGKTLAMVHLMARPAFLLGREVLANFHIYATASDHDLATLPDDEFETMPGEEPPGYRKLHPLWRPLLHVSQLFDPLKATTILIDEISSAFDSREHAKMPVAVLARAQQLRKEDNALGWAGPAWDRCDKGLRGVTRAVYLCSGHWPKREPGALWPSNRVLRWRYFDARAFEEFSLASALSERKGTLRPVRRIKHVRNKHDTQWLYDTRESVALLDHLDDYGVCMRCRGTRRRPQCKCTD